MSLEAAIKRARTEFPECVAVSYVDMSRGVLLGASAFDSDLAEAFDVVAATTADLFQDPSLAVVEQIIRRTRGQSEEGMHSFQEVLVFSDSLLHVFLRSKTEPDRAAAFACRASVNIGIALNKSRRVMESLEHAL